MRTAAQLVVASVVLVGCSPPTTMHSAEGRFSVDIPGQPAPKTHVMGDVKTSSLESTRYGCQYSVAWADAAQDVDAEGAQTVIEVVARHYHATVSWQEPVLSQGMKGWAFRLASAGSPVFEGRVYLTGRRHYLLLSRCPAMRYRWLPTVREQTEEFFRSFHILEE